MADAPNAFGDLLQRWTSPPLVYVLIGIIVIIVAIVLYRHFHKPSIQLFKGETIEYVVKELNLKKQFGSFSRKCNKGRFYHNLGSVSVRRVLMAKIGLFTEKDDKHNIKDISKMFIAFKTGSWLSEIPILNLLFKADYFLIDWGEQFIIKDKYSDTWTLKPNAYIHRFAEVWVCSLEGKELLTEMIYKRMYENSKEMEMNTPKRFVWLNDLAAINMSRAEMEHKLESDKYKNKIEHETGVKK